MALSPDLMRVLLTICLLGMALLASFFLRQRKLTVVETLAWGMLILLVPLLGPFLVILLRPGSKSSPIT
jgi:hypothetical protein